MGTEIKAIHVTDFPATVWRVFVAQCKVKDRTVRDVLEEVLRNWIKTQERG